MRSTRITLSDISNTSRNLDASRDAKLNSSMKLGRTRTASQVEGVLNTTHQSALKRTCTYPHNSTYDVQSTPAKPPRETLEDEQATPCTPRSTKSMMNVEQSATKPQRDYDALKLVELKPFKLDAELFNSYLYRGKMIVPAHSAIARQDALTNSPKFSLAVMETRAMGRHHFAESQLQTPAVHQPQTTTTTTTTRTARGGQSNSNTSVMSTPLHASLSLQTPLGIPRLTRQQERLLLTAQQQRQQNQQNQQNQQQPVPQLQRAHTTPSHATTSNSAVRLSAVKLAATSASAAAPPSSSKNLPPLSGKNQKTGKPTASGQLALHDLKRIIEEDEDLDSLLQAENEASQSSKAKKGKKTSKTESTQRVLFRSPKNGRRTRRNTDENGDDNASSDESEDDGSEEYEDSENGDESKLGNSDDEYDDTCATEEESDCDEADLCEESDLSTSFETIRSPMESNEDPTAISLRSGPRFSTRRQTRLQLQQQQQHDSTATPTSQQSSQGRHSARLVAASKDASFMLGGLAVNSSHLSVGATTPAAKATSAFDTAPRTQKKEEKDKVVQVVVKYPLMGSWTEWKDSFQTCKDEVELYREIKTWRCPYLLRFYGTHGPGIVFEFVDGDSLDALLDADDVSKQTWLWSELGEHISTALYYLHMLNISHNDIKPENVRYSQSKGIWKLLDLGLATDMHALVCRNIGTDGYRAPEVAQRGMLHVKSDVYGVGVMMEEALLCLQRRYEPLHQLFVACGGEIPSFMLEGEKLEDDEDSRGPPKDPNQVRATCEKLRKQITKTVAYRAFSRSSSSHAKTLEDFAETWDELHAVMSDIVSKCLERAPDKRPSIKRLVHVFRAVRRHEVELDAPLRALQAAIAEISK